MKDILKLTLASALMLGAAIGVSHAQSAGDTPADAAVEEMAGPSGHHKGGHRKGRGHHKMHIVDVNADGVIGDDEAAALAEQHFMRLDRDRDGQISEAEFTTPPHGRGWFNWGGEETAAVVKVRKDKFAVLDADKNGNITKVEFFADAKLRLASADTDKDGKVSPWEFRLSN